MRQSVIAIGILVLLVLFAFSPPKLFAQEQGLNELFKQIPQAAPSPQPTDKGGQSDSGAPAGGTPATAAAVVAPATVPSDASRTWSLSGEQITSYHLPFLRDPLDYSGQLLKPRVENRFDLTGTIGAAKIVSDWRVTLWPLGLGAPGTAALLSAGSADITVTPRDNYVEVGSGTLLFRAGYFVDNWGVADGINPTNTINPVDYTQSLSPERLPSLLFRTVYFPFPSLAIEGVFEPYKRGDLFPVDPAAEIPSSLFTASQITVAEPPMQLSSAVYGFKATLYSAAADLSLSYLSDVDPYYTPEVSYKSYTDRSLKLVRGRIQRIGADAKSSLGPFGLWLEACLSITQDPGMTSASIRNPSLAWTAGSDVSYGPGGNFYANLQYTGRYVFSYYRNFYTDYPGGRPDPVKMATDASYATTYYDRALSQLLGDQTEGLLSGIILKSDFPFAGGRWKPGLTAAYYLPMLYDSTNATRYGSLVVQPKIDFAPTDSATLTLGAELMYAWKKDAGSIVVDTADRVGRWNDQSNVTARVDLNW